MDIAQSIKIAIRKMEATLTPRTNAVQFQGERLNLVKSLWWDESGQDWFDAEIVPYFAAMRGPTPLAILDAGGSSGAFSLAAAKVFPTATIYTFEPSARNRILICRNAKLNHVSDRVTVFPCGLWDKETMLSFRTHGAISSLEKVGAIPDSFIFNERVSVTTIDAWVQKNNVTRLDLVKMDIEGAEIEALRGAKSTLQSLRPEMLIQAYHLRNGLRAFETCRRLLEELGYRCEEVDGQPGFLFGTCR